MPLPPPVAAMRSAITRLVAERGELLRRAAPAALTVGLVSAAVAPALIPVILGQATLATAAGGALQFLFTHLQGKGSDQVTDAIDRILKRFEAQKPGAPAPTEGQVRATLEQELLDAWSASGPAAAVVRAELSAALQAIDGVQAALAGATGEVRAALAQGFAELGGSFDEFRWLLADLQQELAEVRAQQAEQLALQKEQLDLQRQQFVRLNLLLSVHQAPAPALVAGTSEGTPSDAPPAPIPCPYKGLAAFQPEDAELFFGRDTLIAELTASLATAPLLALVGPSGCGKSSLVRAGLLPALWSGALPGATDWPAVVLTPGSRPLAELAARLALKAGLPPAMLLRDLEVSAESLDVTARGLLADAPDARLLLVVDQFEELFTLCADEAQRRQFVAALLHAAQPEGRVTVVLTLRADFYGRCAAYPELAAALQQGHALVGALSEAGLREAITRPAARVGLQLEPGLAERILRDVDATPEVLPLLSHALRETWARRSGATLTLAGYEAAGGVRGALAQSAEAAYAALTETGQRRAREVLLRLVEVGAEGAQDTRRRAAPADLAPDAEAAPEVDAVVQRLVAARLLVAGEAHVELAHEALITAWPRLQEWLGESRDALRLHHALGEDARQWEQLGRDPGALYRGLRLTSAEELARRLLVPLNTLERAFLDASRAAADAAEHERAAAARRLRQRALALAVVALVALLAAGAAGWLGLQARQSAAEAERQQATAEAARVEAERQQATAEAARVEAEQQQRVATVRLRISQSAQQLGSSPPRGLLLAAAASADVDPSDARNAAAAQQALYDALANAGGTVFRGPIAPLAALALSPDGRWLATGSLESELRLWDTRDPAHSWVLAPKGSFSPEEPVLKFSPDGRYLASGTAAGDLLLWDLARLEDSPPAALLSPEDDVEARSVAFSPDGRLLAAGTSRGAYIWSLDWLATGAAPVIVDGWLSVAFSPDGRWLASLRDNAIGLWETADLRKPPLMLEGNKYQIQQIVFGAEGRWLAGVPAGNGLYVFIWLWDMTDPGKPPLALPVESIPQTATFDVRGKLALPSMIGTTLSLWDVTQPDVPAVSLAGHTGNIRALASSPDGRWLASAGNDRTVRLWSPERHYAYPETRPIVLRGFEDTVTTVAFSADGRWLAAASADGTARLWDVQTLAASAAPQALLGQQVQGLNLHVVAISPDSERVALRSPDGLRIWNAHTFTLGPSLLPPVDDPLAPLWVEFSPDGRWLASTTSATETRLWRTADLSVTHTLPGQAVHFSPDGRWLALFTGSETRTLALWDLRLPTPRKVVLEENVGIGASAFSGDSRRLIVSVLRPPSGDASGQSVHIWTLDRLAEGPQRITVPGKSLAFVLSPNERQLVSLSPGEADVVIRDINNLSASTVVLTGTGAMERPLVFSPDGRWIASSDGGEGIYLWDMNRPDQRPLKLHGHGQSVSEVVFSPSSRWLAASGKAVLESGEVNQIQIWAMTDLARAPITLSSEEYGVLGHLQFSPNEEWMFAPVSSGAVFRWPLRADTLRGLACAATGRNLTEQEWRELIGDEPYHAICDLPELRETRLPNRAAGHVR